MIKIANNLVNLLNKQAKSNIGFSDAPIKCTPGIGCKRMLSRSELAEIEDAKWQMFGNTWPQDGDPVSAGISSPGWAGIGGALLGGLGGGLAGFGASKIMENTGNATDPLLPGVANQLTLSGGGAALGGLLGGIIGHVSKSRQNNDIETLMESLPVGADLGDVATFSDPEFKAQVARDFQRTLIRQGLNDRSNKR